MQVVPLTIPGVFLIELDFNRDERGFFSRTYCSDAFQKLGLAAHFVQSGISYNQKKGTLRGMHFQKNPYAEAKLVRCVMGSIFDVVIDLRPQSSTYLQWISVELSAQNRKQIYIPEGCAHGFQTLCNDTEVFYQISTKHMPEYASGIRFDDPLIGIPWPLEKKILSERDQHFELLTQKRG